MAALNIKTMKFSSNFNDSVEEPTEILDNSRPNGVFSSTSSSSSSSTFHHIICPRFNMTAKIVIRFQFCWTLLSPPMSGISTTTRCT